MNIIIFSKDRACQLELLLRSMNLHWSEAYEHNIKILYTYSNDLFKQGYDKLTSDYDYEDVEWVKESNFKEDLIRLVEDKKYTIFFVDDQVFKEDFSLSEISVFEHREDILCVSLRLHTNLSYCYTANVPMKSIPSTVFEWSGRGGDYGYPMSLDSHIFRTKDIKPYLERLSYRNPNSLEATLAMYPMNRPRMMCFEKSKTINNVCNKVQTNNQNKHGNITAEFLNEKFLSGYTISTENIEGIKNISCHQEISIKFIK